MTDHLVERALFKELDDKAEYIRKNSIDSNEIDLNYITEEANQHSARIESPKAIQYDPTVDDQTKLTAKRNLDYFKGVLEEAWKWGRKHIELPLTEDEIKTLAVKIDPHFFEEYSDQALSVGMAPYRRITEAVRPTGATNTPPYPAKVPSEMQKLVETGKTLTQMILEGSLHPVELAAYFHFHLARIHPFPDVNGRTSRMTQNLILANFRLPSAVLPEGERRSYHLLLDHAHTGYKRRRDRENPLSVSEGEKQFYTYIADKVNVSLDTILDKNQ